MLWNIHEGTFPALPPGLPDILSLANLFPIQGKHSPPKPGTALWTGAGGPGAATGLWAGTLITPRLPRLLPSPYESEASTGGMIPDREIDSAVYEGALPPAGLPKL